MRVPVTELALEMGSAKVLNIVMLGAYIGYTGCLPEELVLDTLVRKLGQEGRPDPAEQGGLCQRS